MHNSVYLLGIISWIIFVNFQRCPKIELYNQAGRGAGRGKNQVVVIKIELLYSYTDFITWEEIFFIWLQGKQHRHPELYSIRSIVFSRNTLLWKNCGDFPEFIHNSKERITIPKHSFTDISWISTL